MRTAQRISIYWFPGPKYAKKKNSGEEETPAEILNQKRDDEQPRSDRYRYIGKNLTPHASRAL